MVLQLEIQFRVLVSRVGSVLMLHVPGVLIHTSAGMLPLAAHDVLGGTDYLCSKWPQTLRVPMTLEQSGWETVEAQRSLGFWGLSSELVHCSILHTLLAKVNF